MKVLFIAPLPPPIHGQSLASEVFLKAIESEHEVIIVDASKKKARNLFDKLKRNFEVARILLKTFQNRSKADIIYLTISESVLGNIKDILIYMICLNSLDKMVIHLHGGAGMIKIMKGKLKLLASINAFFLKRLKEIIVLGPSHLPVFHGVTPASKVHIVPNFAEEYLFLDKSSIEKKFEGNRIINILFLSNLLSGKGYIELLSGFLMLPERERACYKINFAGAFGSPALEIEFLNKIKGLENVEYHGVVRGSEKRKLFEISQIFCLPTYYPYEGQPISILEAYASGCLVITTNHSGIRDVFEDKLNGFEVSKRSPESIRDALMSIINARQNMASIGIFNNKMAQEKFRASIYNDSLKRIMHL